MVLIQDVNKIIKNLCLVIIFCSWTSALGEEIRSINKVNPKNQRNKDRIIWEMMEKESFQEEKEIIWEILEHNKSGQKDLKKNNVLHKEFLQNAYLNNEDLNFNLLNLGPSVPTTETLNKGTLRISVGQVSSIKEGEASGTGNQNYSGDISYGLSDNILLNIFYADADDTIHRKITSLDTQPENRWESYGANLKWKFLHKKDYSIAVDGALENWTVQSGGCYGFKCGINTPNLFNNGLDMVENYNLIGSFSIPYTKYLGDSIDLTIAPKYIFLPDSQGNKNGYGNFYGNNYGIGFGFSYAKLERLKLFNSTFFPLGTSTNSFDSNLNFHKTTIYTSGLNYTADPNISLEVSISNGFGLTPSTSILTIPSSNDLLYSGRIIYTPTNNGYKYHDSDNLSSLPLSGLSVSSAEIVNYRNTKLNINYDNSGSWLSEFIFGLSDRFNFDLTLSKISSDTKTQTSYANTYITPGDNVARAGGKLKLISSDTNNLFDLSSRISVGRLLAEESRPGYAFTEFMLSFGIRPDVDININPKMAFTGTGNLHGIGTSVKWKIIPNLYLIPETNFSTSKSENNSTFAMSYTGLADKQLDIYTSNSLSLSDMGQLTKSKSQKFGFRIGILF